MEPNNSSSSSSTSKKRDTLVARQLEDLTTVFDDGRRTRVELNHGQGSSINTTGSKINVDKSSAERLGATGANALRVMANTVSHEVEHKRQSDLASKGDFMRSNLRAPKVAGSVINILEDAYIDRTRVEEFPGLRKTQAFVTDRLMADDDWRPPVDQLADEVHPVAAMVEGMVQVSNAGYAKGIRSAPDDVREFLASFRRDLDVARNSHDPETRMAVAQQTFDRLCDAADVADLPPEIEQFIQDFIDEFGPDDSESPDGESSDNPFEPSDGDDESDGGAEDAPDTDDGMRGNPDGETSKGDESDAEADDGSESTDGDAEADLDGADGDNVVDSISESNDSVDPDESAESSEALEAMDNMDGGENIREWFDLDDDVDIESDAEFDRRHDQIVSELRRDETPLEARQQKRESEMELGASREWMADIGDKLSETNLDDEITDAFHELKNADREEPARKGQRLNTRAAVRRAAGDQSVTELYFHRDVAELGDRGVGVALDMSGSMDRDQTVAKMAVAALAMGAEAVGDDFVANAYHDDDQIDLITGPGEDFDTKHLDGTWARGRDPMYMAIEDLVSMLDETGKREKVVFVITDGCPTVDKNGSAGASWATISGEIRDLVHTLRSDGTVVIGIGMGDGIDPYNLDELFGDDGHISVTVDNLVDELVGAYRSQMRDQR